MKGKPTEERRPERRGKAPTAGSRHRGRPLLVTLGDPNGVGPRIVARAFSRPSVARLGLVAVGDPAVFREALLAESADLPLVPWKPRDPVVPGAIHLWTPDGLEPGTIEPGRVSRWAGAQSLRCVDAATELCLEGGARGMVTAPLAKESVSLVLPGFSGHTGHIARLCGVEAHCLCLVHKHLWAAFVTTHIALREVSSAVTTEGIVATTLLLDRALGRSGIQAPRIGIAGLNPHAGEHGLFGDEESRVVEPAIAILKEKGLDVTGPWPADVVFPMLNAGRIDGVTSLYHDQGHPVMKTLAFDFRKGLVRGVNVTLGLPIVRTSPDHGTGFDISWRRSADDGSLLDAIRLADRMSRP